MSKSLGNMVFVRDLRQRHSADAIRLSLLDHHYRQAFEFEYSEMRGAQELADQLAVIAAEPPVGSGDDSAATEALERGLAALDDDLDTPVACEALRALTRLEPSQDRQRAVRVLGQELGLSFTPRPAH
jgi:L-cysteine:1D-myo-inositol 2-amino-2-deoxy-alpha-D-glucopyranoside ligase